MSALEKARKLYDTEGLVGSTEKDVVAEPVAKAPGAEIRSSAANVRDGVIPVGAPLCKRLALAVLSLRAARLPGITAKLAARLAGNWVSVLQYRKCWSSRIDTLFGFSAEAIDHDDGSIRSLSREVAQELAMLSAVAPIVFSNIAVDYLGSVFATDASNQKGGIVEAEISPELTEAVWLAGDHKGSYAHLDNAFRSILRHVGEADDDDDDDDDEQSSPAFVREFPSKPILLYFDFVEICGGAGKVAREVAQLGRSVAPVLDLHYNLCSLRLMEWVIYMLEENRFRSFLIAPPCTTFSPAAHPAVRSYREPLGFDRRNPKTWLGNVLAFRSFCLLRVARRCFRPCGLEQSRLSKMAWLTFWKTLLDLGFSEAVIASCMFGSPRRKEFRLLCYLLETDRLDVRCHGGHTHVRIQGKFTKASAVYVDGVARHIAEAFHTALSALDARERLQPETKGLESPVVNEIALCSKWQVVRSWFWKRLGHIN